MKNSIARIEASIKAGEFPEPVAPVRIYRLIMSPAHLVAGADWQLSWSTSSVQEAREIVEGECFSHDLYMIVSGDEGEIIYPKVRQSEAAA